MELVDCIACQHGDHANHIDVIEAAPKGMLGGARCPCKGECADRPGVRDPVEEARKLLREWVDSFSRHGVELSGNDRDRLCGDTYAFLDRTRGPLSGEPLTPDEARVFLENTVGPPLSGPDRATYLAAHDKLAATMASAASPTGTGR